MILFIIGLALLAFAVGTIAGMLLTLRRLALHWRAWFNSLQIEREEELAEAREVLAWIASFHKDPPAGAVTLHIDMAGKAAKFMERHP